MNQQKEIQRQERKRLERESQVQQEQLEAEYALDRARPSHCLTDPPIITFLPASIDGCALYRMFIPHLSIPNSRFAGVNSGQLPFAAVADADVAVVQRLMDIRNWNAMVALKKEGLKIIYDLDDNMWQVPKWNPAYKIFENTRDGFKKCAIESSVITVSTPALKRVVEENINFKGLPVVVVPNAMDTRLFRPLPKIQRDYVTVAWAGTSTHSVDIMEVFGELPSMLRSEPTMHLAVTGMKINDLQDHPRFHQIDFINISQYPARLASWRFDIMLAPLEDNPFNKCKSNIKMLEAAAMGVPCLVSAVRPYQDFCDHHPDLKFLLCKSAKAWKDKIRQLIHEPQQRDALAKVMREVTEEHYDIEKVKQQWIQVAQEVTR